MIIRGYDVTERSDGCCDISKNGKGDCVEELGRPRVIADSFWLCRRGCSGPRVCRRPSSAVIKSIGGSHDPCCLIQFLSTALSHLDTASVAACQEDGATVEAGRPSANLMLR